MKNSLFSLAVALTLVPQLSSAAIRLVITADNYLPDGVTVAPGSLLDALQSAGAGDSVNFAIPGIGTHLIQTPLGGYPLITANNLTIDGYTQPTSSPNTHGILNGNNAQIKIVLDSTGADSAPNPRDASLPLRRSTRLDFPDFPGNTGYGTSENAI